MDQKSNTVERRWIYYAYHTLVKRPPSFCCCCVGISSHFGERDLKELPERHTFPLKTLAMLKGCLAADEIARLCGGMVYTAWYFRSYTCCQQRIYSE
jgi:hypothetical protein